jgi:hypothetical protein
MTFTFAYVQPVVEAVSAGFQWGITVMIACTAGFLAVSLIAYFIQRSS